MFAKVEAVDLLGEFLGREAMAMTPAIRDEISAPLQYGYTFPRAVLSRVPVVPLAGLAWQEHERLLERGTSQAILHGLWQSGTRSQSEIRALLERIKRADYLKVAPEVEREIFGEGAP